MSLYIMVDFNNETKQKIYDKQFILKKNCSGDFETFDRFHITVKFINNEDKNLNFAISAMKQFDEMKKNKFEILAKNFGKFDSGIYWIGIHNCLDLYRIKYDIEKCLNDVSCETKPEKFSGYTPHITMGYNIKENNEFDKEFNGIPIKIDNICLWQSYKVNDVYMQNCLYRVNLK